MGAADGPLWSPDTTGYRSAQTPPCPCAECVAGPGVNHRRLSGRMAIIRARRQATEQSARQTIDELRAKAGLDPLPPKTFRK